MRTISEGLDAGVITLSIAASSDTIAVGTTDYTARVMLFDLLSGSLLRCFGVSGSDEGQLEECYGLRFTPDGLHILLADNVGNRLSLFTLTGDFVRCIGADILDSPNEVEFTTNGDIIVAEFTIHRISVFSPDGSTRLRRFDGGEQAPLQYPTALAMHGNVLYVLNQNSNCVHVFQ